MDSATRPARILIAEDEEPVREFVERALRHAGYEVDSVKDGMDALAVLVKSRYDLLVTDIVMPGMDGIALALKVAKDYPDMRIMMMTGYAAEQHRAHNLDALIHKVVSKPFSLAELCSSVAQVLDKDE
ncbi:MAG: response regulator [Pseudomonadota bacterium]|nr:response regulator [Pseudomonadota bacterium]